MTEAEALALRELIRAELAPLRRWVEDLTDKTVALKTTVEELKPLVEGHQIELRAFDRTLKKLSPQLERFESIADHTMPEFVRKLEELTGAQTGMQGEIQELQRHAAGAKP